MKKFTTLLREDLNRLYEPPQDSTAQKAHEMGLVYVGFGRYKDPQSGHVTYISQNGKLVPYQKAVKTNTFAQTSADDVGMYKEITNPEIQELHQVLTANYSPDKYNDDQLDALYNYSNGTYADLNNRLSLMAPGTPAKSIEPQTMDDPLPAIVKNLDDAIKKSRAPNDFFTYANLGPDVDYTNLIPGVQFVLKGFTNTSLDVTNVINQADMSRTSPETGRVQVVVLQILVKKNMKGIYLSDFSPTPDDTEFLIPRDSMFQIVTGPNQLVGGDANSGNVSLEVLYYECLLNNR